MKLSSLALLAVPLAAAGCSPIAFADTCDHQEPREAGVSTEGASKIRIVAKAGSLAVKGKPGANIAQARGTACAESSAQLDGLRLIAERRGDTVWIESIFDFANDDRGNRSLSFTVEIPDSLPLEVEDGSGSLEISDVGALRLKDGSGGAVIRRLHGDLDLEDGSGELDIEDIAGAARIQDGSGELRLHNAKGPVDIDDSSGEISVEQVQGDVVIKDASGGLTARHVVGSVRIRDGSGGIEVDDVSGDLTVSDAGSGGLDYDGVAGRVDIPHR